MTYGIIVRPEAEQDLREAAQWYEEKLEGLGREFLVCIDAALSLIKRNPKLYPQIYKNVRRMLIRRFPFGIFYIVEEAQIAVLAIFHASRAPKKWQERI